MFKTSLILYSLYYLYKLYIEVGNWDRDPDNLVQIRVTGSRFCVFKFEPVYNNLIINTITHLLHRVKGPIFLRPFLQKLFLHGFFSSEKTKKKNAHGFQKENLQKLWLMFFFSLVNFLTKQKKICLFLILICFLLWFQ